MKAKQSFREFCAAERTIAGYEAVHMIRKGQVRWRQVVATAIAASEPIGFRLGTDLPSRIRKVVVINAIGEPPDSVRILPRSGQIELRETTWYNFGCW